MAPAARLEVMVLFITLCRLVGLLDEMVWARLTAHDGDEESINLLPLAYSSVLS